MLRVICLLEGVFDFVRLVTAGLDRVWLIGCRGHIFRASR